VPVPEASLAGIAAGFALEHVRPWRLRRRAAAGWSIVGVGSLVIAQSLKAAGSIELSEPQGLVTSGPYAVSRNPMYVGWALIQLGIGLATGSGWVLVMSPVVAAVVHREVLGEERRLGEKFGDEYREYCATTGRYLPM
jgi:protein-S-isoprenylcysteine O-methyltransferase Ste14